MKQEWRIKGKSWGFYTAHRAAGGGPQRGSDELLSQSGAVSNGAAMSPQPHHAADNNNDAKKKCATQHASQKMNFEEKHIINASKLQ
ncbi:hypothetical protein M0804_005837 [Polistes exclamans]|nr:hypothetical protein M0804_005837 [Polistes exclamans]